MAPGEARTRILNAALSCFATKGFQATRIIDIEEAAGLTPGSGATYRHFASKLDMLEAAITTLREQTDALLAPINTSMLGSAEDGIRLGRQNADLLRILFRDLGDLPELRHRIIDDLMNGPYRVAAERTAIIAPNSDAEALSVVFSNAMLAFTLLDSVLGIEALGVNAERFAKAWAHLLELVIADELDCEVET